MADSNSPEANFRLGNVTATVWSNESSSANGNKKFRTVQLEKRYKDGDGKKKGTQLKRGTMSCVPILFGTVSKTCFLAFVLSRFLAVLA